MHTYRYLGLKNKLILTVHYVSLLYFYLGVGLANCGVGTRLE